MARDETPFRRIRTAFFVSPTAIVGIVLLGLILVVALAAPLISPQNPYDPVQLECSRRPAAAGRNVGRRPRSGSAATRRAATCSPRSSTGCASAWPWAF